MSTHCDFLLMRYVPDPFKNEFVNIGVLLLGREDNYAGVRFTRDWSRVRCLDPQADIDILEALEGDLGEQMHNPNRASKRCIGFRRHSPPVCNCRALMRC